MSGEQVLVTGGSGFVGSHCVAALLNAGYQVRTTVRSLAREADVRAMLKRAGVDAGDRLSFVAADLTSDAGWGEAVAGCAYVLHVASPFPLRQPKDENELIVPAREGTLRVLRAARDAGVRRVVVTSSFVAIAYGHAPTTRPYTEEDWTNVGSEHVNAYGKSKTLAERAAWEFIQREGGDLELAAVNPVGIFGPALGPDLSESVRIVQVLLQGSMPALPRMSFGSVDVRDLADLHLRAMTNPAAKGQRFLAISDSNISMEWAAKLLRERMGQAAARVPRLMLPNWAVTLLARVVPDLAPIAAELRSEKLASNAKARTLLGWTPRPNDDTILATAESLVRLGLV
ncbi:aldehyde reductase [Chloroflexia bacterium SDU3-3]|nr:aldehyde reductase [Chloroflexia bacterium SDU3-3]